jgi:hypothetical protein
MNICPGCEAEIEEGLELCPACDKERKMEAASVVEEMEEEEALLTLEDGQSFSLKQDETLLGRSDPMENFDPDLDLSVHGGFESGVSRRHALICRREKKWSLEDLGSTNGTVVNRRKVTPGDPVNLTEGDVIHMGHLKAVFHVVTKTGGVS